MDLTSVDNWLQLAGYEYHCFISYPHTTSRELTQCARYLKQQIHESLAQLVPEPRIYLDESANQAGDVWERKVQRAICRSVAMVAICAPIYYHPRHSLCGIEWAAMHTLSLRRFEGEDFVAIIPAMVKESKRLPSAVRQIHPIDLKGTTEIGHYYYKTIEFYRRMKEITTRIESIAVALARRQAIANCDQFDLPKQSAFLDYEVTDQPFPFR